MLNRLTSNEKASAKRSPPNHASSHASNTGGGLLPAVTITPQSATRVQGPGNSSSGGLISLKQFRQEFERPGQPGGGARSLHWASAAPRHSRPASLVEHHGSKSPPPLRQQLSNSCTETGSWTPVKKALVAAAGLADQTPPHTPPPPMPDPFAPNNIPAILTALSSTRRLLQQHQQHLVSASRIPPRPLPVAVKTLSIQVGPENSLFIVPEPLLLSTSSHMLQHWLMSASAYRFTESTNAWRLPTLDPHVFATIVDWLAKGSSNWHPPDPEYVLELLAAAHYLDLHKLVDQCLDFVATPACIYNVASFGGLAPCLVRAIMRRAGPLELVHAEMVAAQDCKELPHDGIERAGGETKQLWVQHLAQLAGSSGPDCVHWPVDSHHISTGSVRRMVLGLLPADRRHAPFVGRERHMEAVELPASVSDEESRWIARLAKRVARPVHLVLVNGCWPPWTDHVGLLQQRPASPSVHRGVRLMPVGCASTRLNLELHDSGQEDDGASKPILVHGCATVWTIPPTSSAIPTCLWPLTHLTFDSCTALATTTSAVDTLCAWITSSPTCPLTHLTISNSLTLDGMSRLLTATSTRLVSLTLDRNPVPASTCTPKSVHTFLKALRSCTLPRLRLSNAHLPPATLASMLAAWPPHVPTLATPGLGLGPVLVPDTLLAAHPHLTHINVANNRLVARTLVDLIGAASAGLAHLEVLDLGWNQVTAAVVEAVADALGAWLRVRRIGVQVAVKGEHAGWAGGAGGVVDPGVWKRLFESVRAADKGITMAVAGHVLLVAPNGSHVGEDARELTQAIEACVERRSMCIVLGDVGCGNGGGMGWWRKVVDRVDAHPVTVWTTAGIVSNAMGRLWDARKQRDEHGEAG